MIQVAIISVCNLINWQWSYFNQKEAKKDTEAVGCIMYATTIKSMLNVTVQLEKRCKVIAYESILSQGEKRKKM
jgi:hypothetical protein